MSAGGFAQSVVRRGAQTILHALAHEPEERTQFITDSAAYADKFKLSADQREALIKMDMPTIVKMGTHPLVPFLANMQIQRLRKPR